MIFISSESAQQIPADKKSYIVRLDFRADDRNLTGEEIDAAQGAVVAACREKLALMDSADVGIGLLANFAGGVSKQLADEIATATD